MKFTLEPGQRKQKIRGQEARIDFSFKREVFFIVAGGFVGALVMAIPMTFLSPGRSFGYDLTWIVFGYIVGVHHPPLSTISAGITIHIITGISIGIVSGIFLYKTNILNISKPSNGFYYGLFTGTLVYLIFAIPVEQFVLNPEFKDVLSSNKEPPESTEHRTTTTFSTIQLHSIVFSIVINLLFGIILGLFSSLLTIKFGTRYRCPQDCDISFSRIDTLQNHLRFIHGSKPMDRKRIVILGGGFAGVSVLNKLQERFQTDVTVDITMISKDNYLLFTPMLHEIASGMIETRHIVTPIRTFCNRSRFYCADVESIDLKNKSVKIRSSVLAPMRTQNPIIIDPNNGKSLPYDYLVIAVGSETRFFEMSDVEQNAFTIKTLYDAIRLRNHVIYLLEQADQLLPDNDNNNDNNSVVGQSHIEILTFVVVGGGFAGVETAGELNDFIRDSVKYYYHNIDKSKIRVVIVQSGNRLLPEMSEELAQFALEKLHKSGVEIILNSRVIGATEHSVKLKDGNIIPTKTIIWSGGVAPSSLVSSLSCMHDSKSGRIIVDKYLEIPEYKGVFALGDCAFIVDPNTGNPYPPTAQHAIREGTTVAKNIIAEIEEKKDKKKVFDYKTKGMMASIGKRTGVGNLMGVQVQGFLAWWIWRNYYLANLPTLQKKIRVLVDWTIDIFFRRDVTMLKTLAEVKRE